VAIFLRQIRVRQFEMVWNPKIKLLVDDEDREMHRYLIWLSYRYALQNSEDPDTHVGAIIVEIDPELSQGHRVLSQGANRFPSGLDPTPEQLGDRKWIEKNIFHAERDAIYQAAKNGVKTEGTTMYMAWVPCTPCALAIIGSGIERLVMHESLVMKTPAKWQESTGNALELLELCDVETLMYNGEVGGVLHRFYGKEWEP
jgi:dCMP deaminase